MSALPHRLIVPVVLFSLLLPVSALALDVNRCLDDAVKVRTEDLRDANATYSDLLESLLKRFDRVERDAYKETVDSRYRSGEVYRGQSSYATQLQEANRSLNARVGQIWNDYSNKISLCNSSTYNDSRYNYDTNYPTQPYNYFDMYPSTSYKTTSRTSRTSPYYSSPYLESYPYTTVTPSMRYYTYPQSWYNFYPYSGSYSYPYSHPTTNARRDWCRLPTLRSDPGCGYICTVGSDGCYECRQYCN